MNLLLLIFKILTIPQWAYTLGNWILVTFISLVIGILIYVFHPDDNGKKDNLN